MSIKLKKIQGKLGKLQISNEIYKVFMKNDFSSKIILSVDASKRKMLQYTMITFITVIYF